MSVLSFESLQWIWGRTTWVCSTEAQDLEPFQETQSSRDSRAWAACSRPKDAKQLATRVAARSLQVHNPGFGASNACWAPYLGFVLFFAQKSHWIQEIFLLETNNSNRISGKVAGVGIRGWSLIWILMGSDHCQVVTVSGFWILFFLDYIIYIWKDIHMIVHVMFPSMHII